MLQPFIRTHCVDMSSHSPHQLQPFIKPTVHMSSHSPHQLQCFIKPTVHMSTHSPHQLQPFIKELCLTATCICILLTHHINCNALLNPLCICLRTHHILQPFIKPIVHMSCTHLARARLY